MSEPVVQGRCRLVLAPDGRAGALVGLTCGTRFAAASAPFEALLETLAGHVLGCAPADEAALLDGELAGGGTVRGALTAASLELQEGIEVAGLHRLEVADGFVGGYVHHTGWIGVLTAARTSLPQEPAQAFLRKLGMHVAAFPPSVLRREDFSPERVEYEAGGFLLEVRDEDPGLREAWVQSRLARFYAEHCLLDQRWVLDDRLTVAEAAVEALGAGAEVVDFARLELRR